MISVILTIIFAFAKEHLDKIVQLHKNNFQMDYGIQLIQLIFNYERQ